MPRIPLIAVCCLCLAAMAGCKIVKNPDATETAAANATDEERMATYAAAHWETDVLPFVTEKATDIATLRTALAAGPDAAGGQYGFRPAGGNSPWNFIAKGEGKVITADRTSRAAKLELDTDGDGAGDVTVQLGPVMKGTALRDAMPFLVFTDFRDQIEFAKLARALNDHAHGLVALPEGDLAGQTIAFFGTFAQKTKGEPILLTPVTLAVAGGG